MHLLMKNATKRTIRNSIKKINAGVTRGEAHHSHHPTQAGAVTTKGMNQGWNWKERFLPTGNGLMPPLSALNAAATEGENMDGRMTFTRFSRGFRRPPAATW